MLSIKLFAGDGNWCGGDMHVTHPTPNNFEYKIAGQDKLNMVRMETMKA